MSRARDLGSTFSSSSNTASDTEVATAVSTHATAANGHIGRGSTANRPASPTVGDAYFDTTEDLLFNYRLNGWTKVSQEPSPQIGTISPTTAATTGTVVTISGSNFRTGASVKFIGTNGTEYNSPVVTFVSAISITATTPDLSASYEPYDVKVINSDNQFGILENALDAGGVPAWTTSSGSLVSISEGQSVTGISVSATDPDGTSIVYSSSNMPAWASLNTSTGAITGTAPSVSSDTTYSFNVTASDGVNSASRSFSITVLDYVPSSISNMVANYDFSLNSVYSGTGTTVTDIQGGYNMSLSNTTYSSSNGGYLSFNGSSSYGRASTIPTTNVSAGTTYAVWVYPTTLSGTNYSDIRPFFGRGDNNDSFVFGPNSSGQLTYDGWNQSGWTTTGSPVVTTNAWQLIVIAGNNTNSSLYINTTEKTAVASGLTTAKAAPLDLGHVPSSINGNYYYAGRVGAMWVWNKKLSSAEVTSLYNGTKARFGL
jgi:hypothetical protein